MSQNIKIGAKVRFLSDIGGGVVAGFKGNNIVLVEDEDGFQIPTPINEVVVVETDDYNIAKVHTSATRQPVKSKQETSTNHHSTADLEEDDPADRPITYKRPVEERKGGDVLSAYLAFVPIDVRQISNTDFEAYIVNDSNYYIHYSFLLAEGANWKLRSCGEVEPNTKLFVEEIGRDALNELDKACVQLTAYKRDKSFLLKPAIDVQFRIDPVKFYKLHTFQENDFFEAPALLFTIVENDALPRSLVIDPQKLKQEMFASSQSRQDEKRTGNAEGLVRRYDQQQSKSRQVQPRKTDEIVIDLHASEILETTAGMSAADILNYQLDVFRNTLEKHQKEKGKKIVFIHGKGEGVLRRALINELKYKYKKYTYQDASFLEYGYGATQVTIR